MKREMALGILVLGGALVMSCAGGEEAVPEAAPPAESQAAPAADAPPENVVEVERLDDNLFVLRGGGGNSAAFRGSSNKHRLQLDRGTEATSARRLADTSDPRHNPRLLFRHRQDR